MNRPSRTILVKESKPEIKRRQMPVMDGFEAVQALRSDDKTAGIKIIASSQGSFVTIL